MALLKLSTSTGALALVLGCSNDPGFVVQNAAPPSSLDGAADGATRADAGAVDAPDDASAKDPDEPLPPLGDGVATLVGSSLRGQIDDRRERARFSNPVNIAVGPDGMIYVADYGNGVIRVVSPAGLAATLVHQPGFAHPYSLVFTADGTLYAQTDANDMGEHTFETGTFWRIDRRFGTATVVLRNAGRPRGLAALPDGRIFYADPEHQLVGILDPVRVRVVDLAGERNVAAFADGEGNRARFNHPYDAAYLDGVVIVVDQLNHRLRAVTLDGRVSTFAGTGAIGRADGDRLRATFNRPQALARDAAGNLFVSDMDNFMVRRIARDGAVTTFAGVGREGYRDGLPAAAEFAGLEGLDVSPDGAFLYVADGNRGLGGASHRVRRVSLARVPVMPTLP